MTIPIQEEVLNPVHVRYEKNTDYPETTSEDFLVRLGYANDGITEWEKEVKKGVFWPALKEDASILAAGSGSDPDPADFLAFIPEESVSVISDGTNEWREVSMRTGNRLFQQDMSSAYVFWREAGNIRTLPAISGTIEFPYLRKMTRFVTGAETTELDCSAEFLQEYVLARLYEDDKNWNESQARMEAAKDILDSEKEEILNEKQAESSWGFGM